MRILADLEITKLISEPKVVPDNWFSRLLPKNKAHYQHKEREIDVEGSNGNLFRVIVRQSNLNVMDFSIILTLREKASNVEYILIRYNGKHPSMHTNKWEKDNGIPNHRFGPAFHIHRATQRYQESGYKIDGFAEATTKYSDFHTAFSQFLVECGFKSEEKGQPSLFKGGGIL